LTQAGVDPVMAVTGGYAFALRIAALTLIITAAIAVIAWRKTTESEVGLCL
ncbi:MAG: hypothetical protein H0T18_03310, partial [Chloroflexia bacterium]|nr:hypothetical protein [Chloroflexia bacterium]